MAKKIIKSGWGTLVFSAFVLWALIGLVFYFVGAVLDIANLLPYSWPDGWPIVGGQYFRTGMMRIWLLTGLATLVATAWTGWRRSKR